MGLPMVVYLNRYHIDRVKELMAASKKEHSRTNCSLNVAENVLHHKMWSMVYHYLRIYLTFGFREDFLKFQTND